MTIKMFALAGVALGTLATPVVAAPPQAATNPVAAKPAPVSVLVKSVDIPYQEFTLANGLRVLVHTDRKAPIVAVSVWYDVGSKHEPKGTSSRPKCCWRYPAASASAARGSRSALRS